MLAGIVVGGTSILGGEGAVWRTFLGVLFIALIGNGYDLLGLDPLYEQITLGVIMLAAVASTPGRGGGGADPTRRTRSRPGARRGVAAAPEPTRSVVWATTLRRRVPDARNPGAGRDHPPASLPVAGCWAMAYGRKSDFRPDSTGAQQGQRQASTHRFLA